jgi:hypothetical protein
MARACSIHGGEKRILVGKPEGKILLGRPRHRWEDNIRIYLREIGWVVMDWIGTSGLIL